jgi:hypothetical protein
MSQRNGDRSRSNIQRRSKAALRLRRRELRAGSDKPVEKIVRIDGKKTTDTAKASRL